MQVNRQTQKTIERFLNETIVYRCRFGFKGENRVDALKFYNKKEKNK